MDNRIPPELEYADDEYLNSRYERRQKGMRLIAWLVIGALVLTAGGSTVIALLFQ